ncbi:MAG: RNA polymerase sigma factor [Streptosporangiaceae bacterium]
MSLPPFDQVVGRYGADVWRFIVSQVGRDRADDVFQDTMLAALAAYPSLRDPTVVGSWLVRIAARKAIDLFRTADRVPVPVDDPDPGAAPERELPDEQLWARVRALPDKQREAVGLRFVLDMDYRAIGEAMDTSVEAARRNVFEGLTALRRQYGDGDGRPGVPPRRGGR